MNQVLQAAVEEEQLQEKKQEKLKKKFGITGKNIVVVEKTNTFKFTVRTFAAIMRLAASIAVISFAFIGIVALFYEAPRHELFFIFQQVYDEIRKVIPF